MMKYSKAIGSVAGVLIVAVLANVTGIDLRALGVGGEVNSIVQGLVGAVIGTYFAPANATNA